MTPLKKDKEEKDLKNTKPAPIEPTLAGSSANVRKVIIGLVIGVVAVIIIVIGVVGYGIYKLDWNNQLTDSLSNILPFPAATVDGSILTYKDYQSDLATLNYFYDNQIAQGDTTAKKPDTVFIQESVLSRMIREQFLNDAASRFNLTVSQQEIDDEFDLLVAQAASTEEVSQYLKDLYNWSATEFKEKVLRPYLIRLKVQEYIASNEEINQEARQKAEEVLAKLNSGESTFEELAAEYSEDATASSGGDLGFFGRGQMVKEFEDAAFALETGEVSGIVQTQYGFHIIKLIERVPASDEQGEQLRAAHILLSSKDVDEWTNDELSEKSIAVYINDYEWKDDCGLVLEKSETCDNNSILDSYTSNQDTIGTTDLDANTNEAAQE